MQFLVAELIKSQKKLIMKKQARDIKHMHPANKPATAQQRQQEGIQPNAFKQVRSQRSAVEGP